MSRLPLFDGPDDVPPAAASLAPKLRALAERGVFLGTSSWKYEGWLGSLYDPALYQTRGKFSARKFQAECLGEYARVFPIAGGDFSFYQFPSAESWKALFDGSPETLRFGLKVPEAITVPRWPRHARYGARAGRDNPDFLNPTAFKDLFARPLWRHRARVAVLMFEFGTMAKSVVSGVDEFRKRLGAFLDELPPGFRYGVEIRNPEYLGEAYFQTLRDRGAAHVFNSWTRMPELIEQVDMADADTADFVVVRALLRRGQPYEDAVKEFSPYRELQKPAPAVREALRLLAERAEGEGRPAFAFVNNRLEGNAPATVEAVADALL